MEALDSKSHGYIFRQCAKACADTGILQSYQNLYQEVGGNRDLFYSKIGEFGGVYGEVVQSNRIYDVCFPTCTCDLHATGGVDTPCLCECSRQSILYVGESIWGKNTFQVECLGTILSGDRECRFRVIFDS